MFTDNVDVFSSCFFILFRQFLDDREKGHKRSAILPKHIGIATIQILFCVTRLCRNVRYMYFWVSLADNTQEEHSNKKETKRLKKS